MQPTPVPIHLPAPAPAEAEVWARRLGGTEQLQRRLDWAHGERSQWGPSPTGTAVDSALSELLIALDRCGPGPILSEDPEQPPFMPHWSATSAQMAVNIDPDCIAAGAELALRRQLARRLALFSSAVLLETLRRYRGSPPDTVAVGPLLREALPGHPLLSRLLGLTLLNWRSACEELSQRLKADSTRLRKRFGPRAALPVIDIETGLGDRHHGHRQVLGLRLAGGAQLAYKPRNMRAEGAWDQLLEALAGLGFPYRLPRLRPLLGDGYGYLPWQRRVRTTRRWPLQAEQAGALACLAWLFGCRDLHQDNWRWGPSGPCLIDAESLLAPLGGLLDSDDSLAACGLHAFFDSVDGQLLDVGALSGDSLRWPATRSGWRLGEDGLPRTCQWTVPARAAGNWPETRRPIEACAALCSGFSRSWSWLQQHRTEISALAQRLETLPARVVLRPTAQYVAVQRQLLQPASLARPIRAQIVVDGLLPALLALPQRPPAWPLVAVEQQALFDLDVPVFEARADQPGLRLPNGAVAPAFELSGTQALQQRLQRLQPDQAAIELDRLRGSLAHAHCFDQHSARPGCWALRAQRIAEALQANRLDAAALWPAPAHLREQDQGETPLEPGSLYGGSLGILLFLARAALLLNRPALADGLAELPDLLRSAPAASRPGLGHGLGGRLFGLVALAELADQGQWPGTQRAALLELATELLSRDLDAALAGDSWLAELEGGLAGLARGVATLIEATGSPQAQRIGEDIGLRLLRGSMQSGGLRHWRSWNGAPMAGLLHGQAGIALALERLGRALDHQPFRIAARAALAAELALPFPGEGQALEGTLCNGLPGRLLVLLAIDPSHTATAQAAQRLGSLALLDADHLCCGNAGVAGMLQLAETSGLLKAGAAAKRAELMHQRACKRLAYGLHPAADASRRLHPGLFRGLAGIGELLLDLHAPGTGLLRRLAAPTSYPTTPEEPDEPA